MKRKLPIIFVIILFALAAVFGIRAIMEELPYIKAKWDSDQLAEDYAKEVDTTPLGIQIDFEGLWKINPDIVAWIYIPGTQVNYPVCQDGADNNYYLNHTPQRESNILGSIYMYKEFPSDFTDPHMILFGHNMRSGQMFGELSNYTDQTFYNTYPYVYIYLPNRSMECTIYSAYACSVGDKTFTRGYEYDTQEYTDFLAHTVSSSYIEGTLTPSAMDEVITLSTCTDSGNAGQRYIVNCMITREKYFSSDTGIEDKDGLEDETQEETQIKYMW